MFAYFWTVYMINRFVSISLNYLLVFTCNKNGINFLNVVYRRIQGVELSGGGIDGTSPRGSDSRSVMNTEVVMESDKMIGSADPLFHLPTPSIVITGSRDVIHISGGCPGPSRETVQECVATLFRGQASGCACILKLSVRLLMSGGRCLAPRSPQGVPRFPRDSVSQAVGGAESWSAVRVRCACVCVRVISAGRDKG